MSVVVVSGGKEAARARTESTNPSLILSTLQYCSLNLLYIILVISVVGLFQGKIILYYFYFPQKFVQSVQ